MRTTRATSIIGSSLADLVPGLDVGASGIPGSAVGQLVIVGGPIAESAPVDSTTYEDILFIAPVDGCRIVSGWLGAYVVPTSSTNTVTIARYDKSGNASYNVLAATNIDPDTLAAAREGEQLTLSATATNLIMDAGDTLSAVTVIGTPSNSPSGLCLSFVVFVPYDPAW